ncbi:hypothetical protein TNCV_3834951 [Trichonephila clavipes]|nr:hypothetical protein TNCV_3834951 [Trichonephila clavipes]
MRDEKFIATELYGEENINVQHVQHSPLVHGECRHLPVAEKLVKSNLIVNTVMKGVMSNEMKRCKEMQGICLLDMYNTNKASQLDFRKVTSDSHRNISKMSHYRCSVDVDDIDALQQCGCSSYTTAKPRDEGLADTFKQIRYAGDIS